MGSYDVNTLHFTKDGDSYWLDVSSMVADIYRPANSSVPHLEVIYKDGGTQSIALPDSDTKNTAGNNPSLGAKLYLTGTRTIGNGNDSMSYGIAYASPIVYVDVDNLLKVNGKAVLTQHQDISGKVDKVSGKGLSTNDFTDTYKIKVDSAVLSPSAAIAIPVEGSTVRIQMTGITTNHELIRWNFSSSSENCPPVALQWTTESGYFEIQNLSGSTDEMIQPVFALVSKITATTDS